MTFAAQSRVINGFDSVLPENLLPNRAAWAPAQKGRDLMEICLHLGAHRTGSTSLQMFLNANRKTLARDRMSIWGPGRTRSGLFAGLVRDPNLVQPCDEATAERSIGRIRMEISRASQNGMRRLVISEENMIGTMAHNFRRSRLYSQTHPRLSRFAPAFAGHQVRIGLAVRSYDNYWASALAFRIKAGAAFPTEADLDRLTTQPRRWRHVIADVASVFPDAKIAVWPFEAWSDQPAPQLGALSGRVLPRGLSGNGTTHNASLTAVEIAEIAMERGHTDIVSNLMGRRGRYQPFNADQIHKLRQDYATDIDWLIQGSDGLATYFDPTGDTSGGPLDARGRYDDEEARLGQTG
ncbi:hypothetical protein [uncultured Litoreibacter sp.]|uniref:hypothetical protein n=1 Tax=uncultured Litoreibacter sp. TaxID=1392394 RepID=UPI0026218AEA|nr:hypothetical protein [uncultured Litoreibacter sp.]